MITDAHAKNCKLPMAGVFSVAAIWFAGMGLAAIIVRPDSVVGFGPPASMIASIAESDGYLLDAGRFYVAARTGPSTVRSLYEAGAWLSGPPSAKVVAAGEPLTCALTHWARLLRRCDNTGACPGKNAKLCGDCRFGREPRIRHRLNRRARNGLFDRVESAAGVSAARERL